MSKYQVTFKMRLSRALLLVNALCFGIVVASCAPINIPEGRTLDIPPAVQIEPRAEALNEAREPVLTVPLGDDVLVPNMIIGEKLSSDIVGPYELRGETLAGALQLVLAGYDVPIAFQSDEGLTRQITVANLKGSVDQVVKRLCGLADLYCTYEGGILEIKETETFTVALPPLTEDAAFENISTGLEAISGAETVIDTSTGTLIYTVTQRNAERAARYFDRLRADTALIVYETYIWEVQLNNANSTGIQWNKLNENFGAFNTGIDVAGTLSGQVGNPISIGLPTRGNVDLTNGDVLRFISEQGAVKTISQPQLTVLSGSEATFSVNETENFVASLTRTTDADGDETIATTTDSVDTGFTLTISSSWSDSTVYANIALEIDEVIEIENFPTGNGDNIQLPRTTQRELTTQVRARPGDSILLAGLVTENDEYDASGPGLNTPIVPVDRSALTENTELVFLLRPRIVRYVSQEDIEKERQSKILPEKKSFSLNPSKGKKEEFDIDLLMNPSMEIQPMEEQ